MPARTRFIVNPRAGAGRAGRHLDDLRAAVSRHLPDAEVVLTEAANHGRHLARSAAMDGIELLVAVGGDGTIHEVVDGLFEGDEPIRPQLVLGIVPAGTGSDLRRSLELPEDRDAALQVLVSGRDRPVDVAHVTLQTDGGPRVERFINVAGFGANGEVVRQANQMDKRLGGKLTFFGASLKTSMTYAPAEVALRWKGPNGTEYTWQGRAASVFVANGQYCGGGMWVGRGGRMDDGLLDVTILPPDGTATQVVQSRRLYDGSLGHWPGARRMQVRELEARPVTGAPVHLDLDGENPGRLPAIFRVLPGALRIRTP
ncbi:MAG: diacylglycerol kinase family protein [Myxococcota bacterium]|nr:diacylglycerol kinase family protein [Myxococcota bacterium]